jgi:tripartite-type tricarboxylate transporter receptor subunit TctC
MVPAKTPKETVTQHIATFKAALAAPDVQGKLIAQGYEPIGVCGDDFAAHVKRQHADYVRVAKDANIKVE